MKTGLIFSLFFTILLASNINLKAQSNASASDDEKIQRLMKVVEIIKLINGLPIDFKPNTAKILPLGAQNLRRQAELIKQLPKGVILEIGAHSNGEYDIFMQDTVPVHPTVERAEAVRRELIRLGISPAMLKAQSYGAREPIDTNLPNAGSPKNERIEYRVVKMPGSYAGETIIAGKGWGKIVIGASRSDVEAELGNPEKFYEGNILLPNPSSHYFSHGVIVVYDAVTEKVKSVDFVGNPALLDAGSFAGTFRAVAAKPDKDIVWGANAADIIKSYGAPKNRSINNASRVEVVTLTYDQIQFTLKSDQLYYITVSADNSLYLAAKKKDAEEKASYIAPPLPGYNAVNIIVPGRGSGKIVLGATRDQIEAVLGQPEKFIDEDLGFTRVYEANYYAKGIQIEYDPKTKAATSISFFGETVASQAFKNYKLFPGATDKGIRWGMSPAEVIKAYGKPVEERMGYSPKIDRAYESIIYPSVVFGFYDNRLSYIVNDPIWGNKKP